jgi:uncharacterized protein (TIGR02270 family)
MTIRIAAISDIVPQFTENASALWTDRERAVHSLAYSATFDDVTQLDERVDAQLDGLRTCGEEGQSHAWAALDLKGPGEIFTNAVLVSENATEGTRQIEDLIQVVGENPKAPRPVSVALDWVSRETFSRARDRLASLHLPLAQAVFMLSSAMRGVECRRQMIAAMESDCHALRLAGCWAALRLDSRDLLPVIEGNMMLCDASGDLATRTALLWGSRKARQLLESNAACAGSDADETAAATLFRSAGPATVCGVHSDLFRGKATRASVRAAGSAGTPDLVPFLIDCMGEFHLARLAAGAFSSIVGLDLAGLGLTASAPAVGTGPNEDPDDDNVDLDPDESLPWPDPAAVAGWWQSHGGAFRLGTRYLAGTAVTDESLVTLIRGGPQRLRLAAAELAVVAGRPWFDVGAPSFRQRQRLEREALWQ